MSVFAVLPDKEASVVGTAAQETLRGRHQGVLPGFLHCKGGVRSPVLRPGTISWGDFTFVSQGLKFSIKKMAKDSLFFFLLTKAEENCGTIP